MINKDCGSIRAAIFSNLKYNMKHLKLFNSDSEYQTYKESSDFVTPNVSYAVDSKNVYYSIKRQKSIFVKYDSNAMMGPTTDQSYTLYGPVIVEGEDRIAWVNESGNWYVLTYTEEPSVGDTVDGVYPSDLSFATYRYGTIESINM